MDKPSPAIADHANPFVDWLLSDGLNITGSKELVGRLAERLVKAGMPLFRMRVLIRTLHPLTFATHYTWRSDTGKTEVFSPSNEALQKPIYLQSPIAAVLEGSGAIRRRLEDKTQELEFPYFKELQAEGGTDYVAMPMVFHDGKINAVTLASAAPGGFNDEDLKLVSGMLPLLSRMLEVFAVRQTAKTLIETYIGRHTGKRVLDGLVKRGDGEMIHAVIWFCDLRDSSKLAESLPLESFLAVLNDFFDCMAGAILKHGGEVLRFIGDAALAIFPFDEKSKMFEDVCHSSRSACARALSAAHEARKSIKELNIDRQGKGLAPLRYGVALHVGDVMYVNIGTPQRLEFTVIGRAANEAARLEELCKNLDHQILISPDFPRCNSKQMVPLGPHRLRGQTEDWNVYTLAEEMDKACATCYDK
ncbi:MAG: hypothetical protein A3H92_12470 [Rhodospirillales bacterium RIFCSPLOWO2_02_FULL_58_16]|nr:MAG: hypothetical protein A3H92_12470 [Rhodospirillales bacterium RIFCSPLOWO2_02_FULL_58_16]